MKRFLQLIFAGLFIFSGSSAQNLVNNPGFETFVTCPSTTSQLFNASGWSASSYTPDYYHSCNMTSVGVPTNVCGYQPAASGNAYIGLLCYGSFAFNYSANIREYATGMLTSPLVVGTTYNVSFKVARMNASSHEVDHLGAKFTMTNNPALPITNSAHVFSTTPVSDTLNWTTISGTFVADSDYQFIVLGNHFDDANCTINSLQPVTFGWNAYYYVDEVEVVALSVLPVAQFIAPNHICPGTCTNFTNLSVNATSSAWSFPGASPAFSTDVNPANICYNTPGTYDVQLIVSNANGSDTLLLQNFITVFPSPLPQGISQNGDTLFANPGASGYQWYYNGTTITGATDYWYVAPFSGDYNVVATDANGCEVEAVIFNVVAGIRSLNGVDLNISLYPNPVTDELIIENLNLLNDKTDVGIYTLLGEKIPLTFDQSLSRLDCKNLSSGIYFIEIRSADVVYRSKFIKEK